MELQIHSRPIQTPLTWSASPLTARFQWPKLWLIQFSWSKHGAKTHATHSTTMTLLQWNFITKTAPPSAPSPMRITLVTSSLLVLWTTSALHSHQFQTLAQNQMLTQKPLLLVLMENGGNNMVRTPFGIAIHANTSTNWNLSTMLHSALKPTDQMDQSKHHVSAINTVMIYSSTKVPNTSSKPGNYQTLKKVNQLISSTPTLDQPIMKHGTFLRPAINMSSLLIAHTCLDGLMLEVFSGSDQSILLLRQKCPKLLPSTRREWDGTSQKISA